MSQLKLQQLNQALELTKLMQEKAQQADWDELNQLELKRQDLLAIIFPLKDSEVSANFSVGLQHLITLNSELQQFCQQKKHDLQLEIQGLNSNKKAINAYQSA